MAIIHPAAAGRHAPDHDLPDLRRLLLRQSRTQSAQARNQPDEHARHRPDAGELAAAQRLSRQFLPSLRPLDRRRARSSRTSTRRPASPSCASVSATTRPRRPIPACWKAISAARPTFKRHGDASSCGRRSKATGLLMFWVMLVMVPVSLVVGVLAGMREGSRLDRTLVGRLDRLDGDAGICLRHHPGRHLRLVAGLAQRLGGDGDSCRA